MNLFVEKKSLVNDETKTIPMAIDPANINVLDPNVKALVVFPFKLSNIV